LVDFRAVVRPSLLRLLAVLAVLAVAAPLSACGGSGAKGPSKSAYRQQAQAISDKFNNDVQAALPNATSTDARTSLTGVAQLKSASADTASKLGALDTPPDFKAAQDGLVAALRKVVDDATAFQSAVAGNDAAAAQASARTLQQGLRDLQAAGSAFDSKVGTH
jgi:hypothetical protein